MRKPLVALSLAVGASLSVVQAAGTLAAPSNSSPQSAPRTSPPLNPLSAPASSTSRSNGVSGAQIVATAMKYLGYPYTATGNSPSTGFSCIGFASFVYRQNGIPLPGDLQDALNFAPQVSFSQLEPGDLLFFKNTVWNGLSHVAIYIGGGKMIHAEWYNRGVVITSFYNDPVDYNYWPGHYMTANRPWTGAAVPVQVPTNTGPTTSPTAPTTTHPTVKPNAPTAIVTAPSGVNLRRSPSKSAGVIEVLAKGTSVYVIGHAGAWTKVELPDGTIGYIVSAALDTGASSTKSPVAPTSTGTPRSGRTVTSTVSGLRVHSAPSTGASVVGSVNRGQRLQVLGYSNGWYKVRLPNGQVGWVSGAYIRGGSSGTTSRTGSTTGRTTSGRGRTASVAVNVRSGPSTRYSVIAGIPVGGSYQIIGWSHGWAKVRLPNGTVGWVDGAIIGGGSASYGDHPASTGHKASRGFGHTITAGVRVHARPGVGSRVVGLIGVGTRVQIWTRSGSWDRVHATTGTTGWVLGLYVR